MVTYQPNVWASGFTANVAVTNNGAPVTAWTATWTYAGSQQITSGWNHDCLPTDALLRGHGAGRRVHSGPLHFGGPCGSDDGSGDRCIPVDATPAKGVS
ncbi:cellulose binding domain-containing protein [Lentzea sp. NPDC005914]|uniref:cellulose binding domain-containing protein n=1 Tax=Lentzea sp. NPDC005914 TaxID=3154572 RepID=UPI0033D41D58